MVNNVSEVCGGTIQCSASMCKALPDFERRVFSFSHEFGPVAQEVFGPGVELRNGLDASQVVTDFQPDVVVWHNTHADRIPDKPLAGALQVYVAHSAHSSLRDAARKCHVTICVSKWLARKVGLSESTVLYQPVQPPERFLGFDSHAALMRIGRLCTPTAKKWNLDEMAPYYAALSAEFPDQLCYEWVAPPRLHADLRERFVGCISDRTIKPDYLAPKRLWFWEAMLYTSSLEESYGRTVCEAQMSHCVPIVNRRGAYPEQIEHGVTGFLVDSPKDAVEAVRVLTNGDEYIRMSSAAALSAEMRSGLPAWREQFLNRLSNV